MKKLRKLLHRIINKLFYEHSDNFYSQEGEDMVLRRIFEGNGEGFFIDIGAHHPCRFSNTYYFYKKGWRGINIDAMPGSMIGFNKYRPRDINLEIPILMEREKLKYYKFNEPALNGFCGKLSKERSNIDGYNITDTVELEGYPLKEVLEKYVPHGIEINFMSIDAEGLDYEIIQSNDWEKFRPQILLVELLNSSLGDVVDDPIYSYLTEKRYKIFGKTVQTVFFISEEFMCARNNSINTN